MDTIEDTVGYVCKKMVSKDVKLATYPKKIESYPKKMETCRDICYQKHYQWHVIKHFIVNQLFLIILKIKCDNMQE